MLRRLFGGKGFGVVELRFRAEPLVAAFKGEVREKYQVDQALVFIVDEGGRGFYLISEPELTVEEQRIYSLLMENLYFSMKPAAKIEDPMQYVEGFIWDAAEELGILNSVERSFQKFKYYITRDAFGYGLLQAPMMDPDVEEISCTGYGRPVTVIHRRYTEYDWLDTNIVFQSEDALKNFVQRMAQRIGKSLTTAIPFADAMSREGHRIAMTFSDEVTLPGSTLCIRKFPEQPLSIAHLISFNTLTPLMAAYLWLIMEYRGFIMVLGPMASGKTTLMNSILTMINPTLKIASIEDSVAGESEVFAYINGRFIRASVKELIDGFLEGGCFEAAASGHEVCRVSGVKVFTANGGGCIKLAEADRLIRHWVKKEMVKVTTSTGRSISVTADHSLFTISEDGSLKPIRCVDLKPGDYLALAGRVRVEGLRFKFNLAGDERFNGKAAGGGMYARHAVDPQSIPDIIVLDEDLGFLAGVWLAVGFYGEGTVGFSVKDKPEVEGEVERILAKLGLRVIHHSDGFSLIVNSAAFKAFFEEVLGLRGLDAERRVPEIFFAAEDGAAAALLRGYLSCDGAVTRYGVQFNSASPALLKDIQNLLLRFGIVAKVNLEKRKVGSYGGGGVYRGSILGVRFLKILRDHIGLVGEEKVRRLVEACSRKSGAEVDAIPLVGVLREELQRNRNGFCSLLGKRKTFLMRVGRVLRRVSRDDVLRLAEVAPEFRKTRLYKLAAGDIYFDRVKRVEKYVKEGYVYDFGVPGTENFICEGFICHNTPELRLPHSSWQRFKSRHAYSISESKFDIDLFDLVRLSLRYRPDYIVVGEVRGEEVRALIQAASLGHGCCTTFHAEDPNTALIRLRSPPMSVPEGNLMLISCFALLNRVKMLDGRIARRVLEITEVESKEGGISLRRIFAWDAATDSFSPTDASEVVGESVRLGAVMRLTGWSRDRLAAELEERAGFLRKIVEEGKFTYAEFSEEIRKFYIERRGRV